MSVANLQVANETTFNNAFMSRTASDTDTVAIVALNNAEPASGAAITNLQGDVNDAKDAIVSNSADISALQATAPSSDEKDALAGTAGSPSDTNRYVTQEGLGNILGDGVFSVELFALANAQGSATDLTGALLDKDIYGGGIWEYMIYRQDASEGRRQWGKLVQHYNYFTTTWRLDDQPGGGEISGVTLQDQITSGGQIRYKTDNMAGGSYIGFITLRLIMTFPKET